LTGRRTFAASSQAELTASILERVPPPPSSLQPGIPEALDGLIEACLAKDPAARWQHAHDVVLQLRALEGRRAVDAPGQPSAGDPDPRIQYMDDVKLALEDLKEESGGTAAPAPPFARRRPVRTILAVPAAVLLLLVAGLTSWLWQSTDSPQVTGRAEAVLTPITADSGLSFDPALSPDGKLLAYASDRSGEGHLDIWVQQVGGGEPVRLTRHEADDHSPSFSPDGTLIAFVSERRGHGGGIYVMPALAGEERLVAGGGVRPRFSPDGAWIAYSDASKTFVVPAGGGPPRQLAPEFLDAHLPVWFPDGTRLLFAGNRDAPGRYTDDWYIAPLDGGPVRGIGADEHLRRSGLSGPFGHPLVGIHPEVSPRGDAVIFSATHGASANLWQIRLAPDIAQLSGPPEQLTFLASGAGLSLQPSVARSGDVMRIAFWNVAANMDVWSLALDPTLGTALGPLVRLTRNAAVEQWPSLSGDGKQMVYNVRTRENWDVWLMDLDTGRQAPLAAGPAQEMWPKITRDGRTVAYAVEGPGTPEIHALTIGSAVPEKMCEGCTEPWDWSSDGQYLLYRTGLPRQVGVLRRGSSGTVVLAHPDYGVHVPRFSPDDRWILFTALPRTGGEGSVAFVAPFRGDATIPVAEWQVVADGFPYNGAAGWSPDGNLVYFMSRRDGFLCLWAQRLHPTTRRPEGEPFEVQPFHRPQIRSMALWGPGSAGTAVARDRMAFSMVEATGNIWMAEVR
jgi:eukaryotic-like serine/threonine-protein kinase